MPRRFRSAARGVENLSDGLPESAFSTQTLCQLTGKWIPVPSALENASFAAKEAFSKALGTGIHFPVNWHNVWVENALSGKPSLKFSTPLAALLKRRGIENVYVSLTDEIGMACAFVVVVGATPKARRLRPVR